jgi:capsular polysaccharide transport system permease protein
MAILESTEASRNKVSADNADESAEARAERKRRRQERRAAAELAEKAPLALPLMPPGSLDTADRPLVADGPSMPLTPATQAERLAEPASRQREKTARRIPWTALSFCLMVLVPAVVTTFYFLYWASPQYRVEAQYSVRGSSQSSMSTLGLSGLLGGSSVENSDSYIVASYVESMQLIIDVQKQLGIDLRQYYVRSDIDWLYRIKPDMPLEKFTSYWQSMTDVSFNSTTGNITMYVYAFSADDSKAIADAVLKVSENLVNNLSESNRKQMMLVASKQVDRAEERLRKVREQIRNTRIDQGQTDYATIVAQQNQLVSGLRSKLSDLNTRYLALLRTVDKNSPNARVLQGQIDALEAQLKAQESELGGLPDDNKKDKGDSTDAKTSRDGRVADSLTKFEELTIEQGFATQAYTTALAAFETSIAEAQKQERYFATFVQPTRPEIALYPLRYLDSLISFLVLTAFWMISQFLFRSFRDHAI